MAPKVECYILHRESPNADALLYETLFTLDDQDYENLEVKVIENGCSVPRLHWSRKIHLRENLGVAKGYNVGLGAESSPYVLLLNNDVAVGVEMVSRLVAFGKADDSIGIVCPRIYYYGTNSIWYDGGLVNSWTGVARHANIRQRAKIGPVSNKARETDRASSRPLITPNESP